VYALCDPTRTRVSQHISLIPTRRKQKQEHAREQRRHYHCKFPPSHNSKPLPNTPFRRSGSTETLGILLVLLLLCSFSFTIAFPCPVDYEACDHGTGNTHNGDDDIVPVGDANTGIAGEAAAEVER
jgi:hypothetical protein